MKFRLFALAAFCVLLTASLLACNKGKSTENDEDTTWTWARCEAEWDTTDHNFHICDSLQWESIRAECEWEHTPEFEESYAIDRKAWNNHSQQWQGLIRLSPRIKELRYVDVFSIIESPNLTDIPKEIWEIQRLKALNFVLVPKLNKIPEITKDNQVNFFQVNSVGDSIKPPKGLEHTKIKEIIWIDVGASRVPEEFRALKDQLTILFIGYNKIDTLPDWLAEMTSLNYLDAQYNQIKSIPESFTKFENLDDLVLNDNLIDSLPAYTCDLPIVRETTSSNRICSESAYPKECWTSDEILLHITLQHCN